MYDPVSLSEITNNQTDILYQTDDMSFRNALLRFADTMPCDGRISCGASSEDERWMVADTLRRLLPNPDQADQRLCLRTTAEQVRKQRTQLDADVIELERKTLVALQQWQALGGDDMGEAATARQTYLNLSHSVMCKRKHLEQITGLWLALELILPPKGVPVGCD